MKDLIRTEEELQCALPPPSPPTPGRWRSHLLIAARCDKALLIRVTLSHRPGLFLRGPFYKRLLQLLRQTGNDTGARVCMNAGTREYRENESCGKVSGVELGAMSCGEEGSGEIAGVLQERG